MSGQQPARIGRYHLGDVIGVGSFATVHAAFDERLESTVAIKVLAENHALNPEIRARFIAEGRSLRRVNSPHIVTVHDIGENERQQPYLVLEHADRGTLAQRADALRADGWHPGPDDIVPIARGLAAAIEDVHNAHLVHRDLSPGNVLLQSAAMADPGQTGNLIRPDERLVIADLGMCKDLARSSGLTVAGGTDGFRPPEQVGGPNVVDERADIWSLSALLRWLCDGAQPPARFLDALQRGLADDPHDRHPDVAAWLADVERALVPAPTAAPTATATSAPAGAHARRSRQWRRPVIVVLMALIVGAVVSALVSARWVGDDPPAVVNEADGTSIDIDGPAATTVGAATTFTAQVSGVDHWAWTLPTGEHLVDEDAVTLTATSSGRASIVLRARTPDGTDLEVTHAFTVEE